MYLVHGVLIVDQDDVGLFKLGAARAHREKMKKIGCEVDLLETMVEEFDGLKRMLKDLVQE